MVKMKRKTCAGARVARHVPSARTSTVDARCPTLHGETPGPAPQPLCLHYLFMRRCSMDAYATSWLLP
ncbi:hypothetical protein CIC12_14085 [Burkholderia sp. SG-MS1]|nr:hypothetical protein [Paraburkholderia sp. SG-MS1]